jgi:Zn-dependent peptidase ImmA (M78 family)
MASFSYLNHEVKVEISKIAEQTTKNLFNSEPPIDYRIIFQEEKLSLSHFDNNSVKLREMAEEFKFENINILRGVLFVDQKKVLVKDDGYPRRNNFVYGHELAHWMLPWHKALLYQCTQFDLSKNARKQLEQEANFFAGELAFCGKQFMEYLLSSDISFNHYKTISDIFDMSKEATIRRAVELEPRPCAFLSLQLNEKDPLNYLKIKYVVHSEAFVLQAGNFDRHQSFPQTHQLAKIVTDPIRSIINQYDCELTLGKTTKLKTEVWNNGYNVLVLCQPIMN